MFRYLACAALLAGSTLPSAALAQSFPDKTVTVVVPFSPGGSNDTMARYMANALSQRWGQSVVVENRAGGGSAIGAAHVATSDPDGYTVLFVSTSYTFNAATRTDLPFDPLNDLDGVAMIGRGGVGVLVGPDSGITSLDDLIAKSKDKEVFYGTAGMGSAMHFTGAFLADSLGIEMTPVPYPGGSESFVDLLGGRIDLVSGAVAGLLGPIQNGAIPIAVMGDQRLASLPDVPTSVELGYPDAQAYFYWIIYLPPATPEDVKQEWNAAVTEIFNAPEGVEFLKGLDASPVTMTLPEVEAYIVKDIEYWKTLAKKIGVAQ